MPFLRHFWLDLRSTHDLVTISGQRSCCEDNSLTLVSDLDDNPINMKVVGANFGAFDSAPNVGLRSRMDMEQDWRSVCDVRTPRPRSQHTMQTWLENGGERKSLRHDVRFEVGIGRNPRGSARSRRDILQIARDVRQTRELCRHSTSYRLMQYTFRLSLACYV